MGNDPAAAGPSSNSHVTDWDERYRAGDTPWEKGAAHPAVVEWLRDHPVSGRVLVPGCGLGHDVRAFAAAGATVTGLDVSSAAVDAARRIPAAGAETYAVGDFFAPPAAWMGTFDGLVEHTCFCAIDPMRRGDYARAAASLLRPGGWMLAVFFLDPDHDEDGPPFGCTREEIDRLFRADFALAAERFPIPTYPGRERREMLRLWRRR